MFVIVTADDGTDTTTATSATVTVSNTPRRRVTMTIDQRGGLYNEVTTASTDADGDAITPCVDGGWRCVQRRLAAHMDGRHRDGGVPRRESALGVQCHRRMAMTTVPLVWMRSSIGGVCTSVGLSSGDTSSAMSAWAGRCSAAVPIADLARAGQTPHPTRC